MFIRWMEAHARRGWFIGDLHRHWLPYYGFGVLAWLARWHHFVLSDGRISIARSFRAGDWRRLMRAAGLAEARRRDHLASAVPALRRAAIVRTGDHRRRAGGRRRRHFARPCRACGHADRAQRPTPADKVCGDFLSAEAIEMIEGLGVDLSAASHDHSGAPGAPAIASRPRACRFAALGLSRRALDEALLRQAQADRRHGAARPPRPRHPTGRRIVCGSIAVRSGSVVADTVFLATGKHDLRGATRTGRGTGLVGHEDVLRARALAARGAAPPCRTDPVRRRLCRPATRGGESGGAVCAGAGGKAARRGGAMGQTARCAARMSVRISRARLAAPVRCSIGHWQSPACRMAMYTRRPRATRPVCSALGDQAAVIASLTGDGVALALASGSLAARTWLARQGAATLSPPPGRRSAHARCACASAVHRLCLAPASQPWVAAACALWPGVMRLCRSRDCGPTAFDA